MHDGDNMTKIDNLEIILWSNFSITQFIENKFDNFYNSGFSMARIDNSST